MTHPDYPRHFPDPKDMAALRWAEQMLEARKTSREVVGEFIINGARTENVADTEPTRWNPRIYTAGPRILVCLHGFHFGTKVGFYALRAGLNYPHRIESSVSFKTDDRYLVPYPRFNDAGGLEIVRSRLYLLNEQQLKTLEQLTGLDDPYIKET